MIVFISAVWVRMYFTRLISARTGHNWVFISASWCIVWARMPFFWFEIFSVAAVQCCSRCVMLSEASSCVLLCQNAMSQSLNCCVRRLSDGLWWVYLPTRSK